MFGGGLKCPHDFAHVSAGTLSLTIPTNEFAQVE